VTAYLEHVLAAPSVTGRFLAGKVTFCALVPMRSIPFQVVCLVGLDDGVFPRQRRSLGFDLMATDFRAGDRSRRDDDRYLFLEALLSARRVLHLSYTGRDVRDDRALPPSVLVTELLRYLARGFCVDPVRTHPLQPFDARYFEGPEERRSAVAELCDARRLAGTREDAVAPFVVAPLPAADATWRTIDVDRLVDFFRNPSRFVLRERLGIRLEAARGEVETREPFVLDALARYRVRTALLDLTRTGAADARIGDALRARGLLPHGEPGRIAFEQESAAMRDLTARVDAESGGPAVRESVDLTLGEFRVFGTVATAPGGGVVDFRPAKVKAKDRLGLWVRHLVLASATGRAGESRWLGPEDEVRLAPVTGATELLADLLALYWEAIHVPLPLFPQAALAAASSPGDPRRTARKTWTRSTDTAPPGEGDDEHVQLLFRGRDPFADPFEALASRVWGPILAHQRGDV
jgi:exodeoxyribonuclease V gamma subunit